MISREAAYAALFARLSAVRGFNTISRQLKHWSDVAQPDQPALFQAQGRQVTQATADNMPTRWRLLAELYVYVRNDDPALGFSCTALNNLVDAIEGALQPPPGFERQTLGGVVEHCRIAGDIETDEGVLGAQAVAIIPIEIIPEP
jgi:hypothetical protein